MKLDIIGKAITDGTKLHMIYLKANDTKPQRVIRPLTLGDESYKGHDFVGMQAYCTARKENRMFNVYRILDLTQV